MSFDAASLVASFMIGLVGFALLGYGKKQQRFPHMVVGIALMVYPYFVPTAFLMVAIGLALIFLLWLAVKRGF